MKSSRLQQGSVRRSARVMSLIAAAGVAAAPLAGCYQRVVRARGLGADSYNVSEPYQESGKLDEWLFGSPGPKNARPNNSKLPPS